MSIFVVLWLIPSLFLSSAVIHLGSAKTGGRPPASSRKLASLMCLPQPRDMSPAPSQAGAAAAPGGLWLSQGSRREHPLTTLA